MAGEARAMTYRELLQWAAFSNGYPGAFGFVMPDGSTREMTDVELLAARRSIARPDRGEE